MPAEKALGRRRLRPARALALAVAWGGALLPTSAFAIDPFEIQVYDGTANAPGVPGLELHVNTVPSGRTTAEAPELPTDGQSHITFEPSFGVTPFWEVGAYLQTALLRDGTFDYAGTKIRSKFVMPQPDGAHWRLGVNVELSYLPSAYDRSRFGSELRPIVAFEDDLFLLALNPIVDMSLAAPDASDGPSFEPALLAKVKIARVIAAGIEYYASFGPIAHPLPWEMQEHYLYEVLDIIKWEHIEINAGIGQGLTSESNPWTAKLIVGYAWESLGKPP